MKCRIIFKDDTPKAKLLQTANEKGGMKVVGVEIDADVIEWPKREVIDKKNIGDNIIYHIKAGETAICRGCGLEKPRKAFGKSNSNKLGLQGWCNKCKKQGMAEKRRREMENADEQVEDT